MGIVHTHRGRLAPALVLAVLMALAVIVTLGLAASPASAQQSFTQCSSCHNYTPGDTFHKAGLHASQACGTCHTASGLVSSACVSCHGSAATIIAGRSQHVNASCGTTNGCHGFQSPTPTPSPTTSATPTPTPTPTTSATPTPTPTPTTSATPTPTPTPTATAAATSMTLKATPTIVRLNRSVKTIGTAGPRASLAGAKVALKIERKVGTRWVKMRAVTRTVSVTGAFSYTYKVVKKGPHRVTATIAKTSTHTAKKLVRSFRVR